MRVLQTVTRSHAEYTGYTGAWLVWVIWHLSHRSPKSNLFEVKNALFHHCFNMSFHLVFACQEASGFLVVPVVI